jgi:hypothetical protein
MRLGRSLRRAGQLDEGLRVYDDLARLAATPVEGLPAELVAREARCTVLEKLGRKGLLDREARELYGRLVSGYWQLPHAAWDFLMEETRSWLGSGLTSPPGLDSAIALSAAAESLWKRRPELPPAVYQTGHSFMLVLHIFFANLFIMLFPFSKVMHSIFSISMNKLRRG